MIYRRSVLIASHTCIILSSVTWEVGKLDDDISTIYFIVSVAKTSKIFITDMGIWRPLYLLLGNVAPCHSLFKRGQGS